MILVRPIRLPAHGDGPALHGGTGSGMIEQPTPCADERVR
jgi:hypothetical protein